MERKQLLTIAKRLLDGFVFWPAAMIASLALALMLIGGSPIRDSVSSVYAWADSSVRGAPKGMVKTFACEERSGKEKKPDAPVGCKKIQGPNEALEDSMDSTEDMLRGGYQGLVLICFTIMVFKFGWRELAGFPPQAEQPGQAEQ